MPSRLVKEDYPVWPFPISRPYTGPVLGNTTVGLMLWGSGAGTLELSLCRADFWSRRGGAEWHEGQSYAAIRKVLEAHDAEGLRRIFPQGGEEPTLLPFGHLALRLPKGAVAESATLDVRKATLRVTVRTKTRARKTFTIVVDWPTGTVVLALPAGLALEVVPVAAWHNEGVADQFRAHGAEAPLEAPDGFVQTLPQDPAGALAIARSASGREVFAASLLAQETDAATILAKARHAAAKAAALGAKALFARTAERWADFWAKTPVLDLPNSVLQRSYEYGMYKFGAYSSGEPGSTPCTLQGPWYDDYAFPPWSGDYHFNINVQECYWPAIRGNHLDHLKPLFKMVGRWTERLRWNAKVFVGIDDGLMLSHAVDDTGKAITTAFWTGMMDHGSTMWVADILWQYYRFGGDKAFLRTYSMPFFQGAFNVFYQMLDHEKDGSLSLPVGPSPEYRGAALDAWGRNASFQLAAAHRLAENLVDAAAVLGVKADPRWTEVLEKLPKAALVPHPDRWAPEPRQSIALWEGLTLEGSHRHHSHMASIFPFDTIDCESPEWHGIVDCTFRHWYSVGMSGWSGWCVPWASILHTRVGNAEMAEFLLEMWERLYTNEGHGTLHNPDFAGLALMGVGGTDGPHYETEREIHREIMQLDAGGSCVEAVFEMLLHDRRGVNCLFRGAPKRWRDVSFRGILAPGGVLVSAARKGGEVTKIELRAQDRATVFRLANPWPGCSAAVRRESGVERLCGDVLDISLAPGETIRLKVSPS